MAQQFSDQGGAATSEPSRLRRWLASQMMRRMADPERRSRRRQKLEQRRRKSGRPHRVEYFHQVEDAYSHLAAQLLQPLLDTYEIELVTQLVAGPSGKNAPEPELLLDYAASQQEREDLNGEVGGHHLEAPVRQTEEALCERHHLGSHPTVSR